MISARHDDNGCIYIRRLIKDVLKNNFRDLCVDIRGREQMTVNRAIWKKLNYENFHMREALLIEHPRVKQALRKQDLTSIPDTL